MRDYFSHALEGESPPDLPQYAQAHQVGEGVELHVATHAEPPGDARPYQAPQVPVHELAAADARERGGPFGGQDDKVVEVIGVGHAVILT
jgi:hypothetical protein